MKKKNVSYSHTLPIPYNHPPPTHNLNSDLQEAARGCDLIHPPTHLPWKTQYVL